MRPQSGWGRTREDVGLLLNACLRSRWSGGLATDHFGDEDESHRPQATQLNPRCSHLRDLRGIETTSATDGDIRKLPTPNGIGYLGALDLPGLGNLTQAQRRPLGLDQLPSNKNLRHLASMCLAGKAPPDFGSGFGPG